MAERNGFEFPSTQKTPKNCEWIYSKEAECGMEKDSKQNSVQQIQRFHITCSCEYRKQVRPEENRSNGGYEKTKFVFSIRKSTIIPGNSNKEEIEKGKFYNSHQLEISPSSSTTQPQAKVQKEMFTAEIATPGIPVLKSRKRRKESAFILIILHTQFFLLRCLVEGRKTLKGKIHESSPSLKLRCPEKIFEYLYFVSLLYKIV